MSKGLRVFLLIVIAYAVVVLSLTALVPRYANSLADRGYKASDLSGFQRNLITTSDLLKNLGLGLFLVVIVLAAIAGLIVNTRNRNAS